MNCISAFSQLPTRWALLASLLLAAACGVPASESADRANTREYSLHYTLAPDPSTSTVLVTMRLRQPFNLVREISFALNTDMSDIGGDGDLRIRRGRAQWFPPSDGGVLEWRVVVHNTRGKDTFDALLNGQWGLFRAEDVIPRARTRTLKGATSRTTLAFELPSGWSVVTEYSGRERPFLIDRKDRRFDEPTGWIAMGNLGVRRETIAGTRVAIAAPQGHNVRRMEMLALLNWTLPELNEILPDALPRLTIVSAGAPMWRGGLSAPASFFLHADRPLISENGTSSLLHEVIHTALGLRPQPGSDWIVEGLAEYYSIELLRRGKAISARRARMAFEHLGEWAEQADTLCGATSTGASTALAVVLFKELDQEISDKSEGAKSLDDLLPLLANDAVDLETLATAASGLIGSTPDALHSDSLPGCPTIAGNNQEL
ncbi:MAG: hypothetical protein OER91_05055 [Gammaproteobacteria bacterium]|nr:hypothetical protein [Gammaproteobacteria bacterium]